jgi:hypothetical protein
MNKATEGEISRYYEGENKYGCLWNVAQCSLLEVYRRFRSAFRLHHQNPDCGGHEQLRKVFQYPSDNKAENPEVSHIHTLFAVRT